MYIRNEVTKTDIDNAEQVLISHGVDPDKVEVILQKIGYELLDEELYPGLDVNDTNKEETSTDAAYAKGLIYVYDDHESFLPAADASRTYEPYEIYHLIKDKFTADDIDSRLESYLEDEKYKIPEDVADTLAETLVESFKRALSMNDSYWETYWMQIDSVIEEALKPYEVKDGIDPAIGSKGFCVKSYMEDDVVNTSEAIDDFEEAVNSAMCFDCDEFDEYREEYEESLGYEPNCLVSVVDIATGTCMFWANTEGDFGSDYVGEDDDKYNQIIDRYM